jgi:hypothetical protein
LPFTYRASLLCYKLSAWSLFHSLTRQLKDRIEQAKQEYINKIFADLDPQASASTILHALRRPSNLKTLKTAALPCLLRGDGSHCNGPLEAREEWIAFFQQMEGGVRLRPVAQREHWITGLCQMQKIQFDLDVNPVGPDMPRSCSSYFVPSGTLPTA